jgi:hypothetical protein
MSGMPLETCWAFNERWNNKFYCKVASCWLFYWVILRCTDPLILNLRVLLLIQKLNVSLRSVTMIILHIIWNTRRYLDLVQSSGDWLTVYWEICQNNYNTICQYNYNTICQYNTIITIHYVNIITIQGLTWRYACAGSISVHNSYHTYDNL